MSLEKAIIHKKEYRKPYYDCRDYDKQCRNHGSCSFCKENRLYNSIRNKQKANQKIKDFLKTY